MRRLGQAGRTLLRRPGGRAHRGAGRAARRAGAGRPRGAAATPSSATSCAASSAAGRARTPRAGALRPGFALLPRRRRGSGRGLCLGLGRDRPAAGRAGPGQRPDQAEAPRGRPWRSWTRTRPGASTGARTSAPGCRTWPTAPSTSCTGCTSISPSRPGGSRPCSPRLTTAGSTTPGRRRTGPGPARCGGRCRRAWRLPHLEGGHARLPRGRARPSPAGLASHGRAGEPQPLAAAECLGLRATARAGRSTPSG